MLLPNFWETFSFEKSPFPSTSTIFFTFIKNFTNDDKFQLVVVAFFIGRSSFIVLDTVLVYAHFRNNEKVGDRCEERWDISRRRSFLLFPLFYFDFRKIFNILWLWNILEKHTEKQEMTASIVNIAWSDFVHLFNY